MRRMTRDMWLSVGLIVALLGVLALTAYQEIRQEAEAIPLYSASEQPTGAKALTLWLEAIGLEVDSGLQATFGVPQGTDVAFLFTPNQPISLGEQDTLLDWVEDGGVLVVSEHRLSYQSPLVTAFELDLAVLDQEESGEVGANLQLVRQGFAGPVADVSPGSPLFSQPVLSEALRGPVLNYFASLPEDAFALLVVGDRPVTIAQPQGDGYIVFSTVAWPFANAGLREPMAPHFVQNILAISPREVDKVWFDEWHHGLRLSGGEVTGGGPGAWLRNTAGGRAVMFTMALIFVAILLSGRRLGRPVPLRSDIVRRAPLEYITAMANMSRRAGHRLHVQRHYHTQLKRGLGERYRLDPSLPDEKYVDLLMGYRPDLEEKQVRSLLLRLRQQKLTEPELVAVANEVADLLATTRRGDERGCGQPLRSAQGDRLAAG